MPDSVTRTLHSETETESVGEAIAKHLKPGTVIALCGTLGSGKTRLTQSIARALGVTEPVVSPTYTICIPYDARLQLIHMDAYRIEHAEEVDELDLFESVADGSVLIVEWADRIRNLLPDVDLWIEITPGENDQRTFVATSHSEAGRKLIDAIATQ